MNTDDKMIILCALAFACSLYIENKRSENEKQYRDRSWWSKFWGKK